MWSPVSVKTIHGQIFRPSLFLVWAAESLLLGAFIIGLFHKCFHGHSSICDLQDVIEITNAAILPNPKFSGYYRKLKTMGLARHLLGTLLMLLLIAAVLFHYLESHLYTTLTMVSKSVVYLLIIIPPCFSKPKPDLKFCIVCCFNILSQQR